MDWQKQYCENVYTIKINLYLQCNPYQNSSVILHQDRKVNPKVHMETQNTLNSQRNSESEEQHWKYHNTQLYITER
jgi:hypothetical protein